VVDTSFGEGFEEGRMTGLEEGKYHEKLSIARNLLSLGFSMEQIAQATGLSLQQVENLH
jgi:predicted transposase/invertase (TIGR01784 family)